MRTEQSFQRKLDDFLSLARDVGPAFMVEEDIQRLKPDLGSPQIVRGKAHVTHVQLDLRIEDLSYLIDQNRHFLVHDGPQGVRIKAEVGMRENVTKPRDPPPIDFRVARSDIIWDSFHSLADHFEIADNGVKSHPTGHEFGTARAFDVLEDVGAGPKNVFEE